MLEPTRASRVNYRTAHRLNFKPITMASRSLAAFLILLVVTIAATEPSRNSCSGVNFHCKKLFTPSETVAIIQQMKSLPVQLDDRVDKSVKRTNYFCQGLAVTSPESPYAWIFKKILPLYSTNGESMESFVSRIDFILLHEFDESGFFDWHVDTKPGDGTHRTDNINVMLTDRSDYKGGDLMVGSTNVEAEQGDCYSYPASFPHKVGDLTRGQRHTFIIAMTSRELSVEQQQAYWDRAEENHKEICAGNPAESKLHLLHGEFLIALGRPDQEVDCKFADMYASTSEAEQYATNFSDNGEKLRQAGKMDEATGFLAMADMIRSRLR